MNILNFALQTSGVLAETDSLIQKVSTPLPTSKQYLQSLMDQWIDTATDFGLRVVVAIIIFFIGWFVIGKICLLFRRFLERKEIDGVAVSLLNSVVTAFLYLFLGIGLISTLGFKSVSFAAVLGSLGLAVGMSLSGQLQNLAGGIIIMLTKPFKIGDFITAQDESGTVQEVTLFHTKISSADNKMIFIPNGALSSGVVVNVSHASLRRVEWTIGIEYDEDYTRVRTLLQELIREDRRIQTDPAPLIALDALAASSVNVLVRAWVKTEDYWSVYWDFNQSVYERFNQAGIGFPFPQLTIHQSPN